MHSTIRIISKNLANLLHRANALLSREAYCMLLLVIQTLGRSLWEEMLNPL